MAYDTALTIVNLAAVEVGLSPVADVFGSTDEAFVQLRTLLTQCGRELYATYQWQQFVRVETIDTGASPPADGKYDLPADYGYFINSTGWSPNSNGVGLPLGGPMTRQQYAYLIGSGMAASTIYISFNINEGQLEVLPAPAPESVDITFHYMSNAWVESEGDPDVRTTLVADNDDVVMYEPILISKFLAARYAQAKALPSAVPLTMQFQNMYQLHTGVNQPAPMLSLVPITNFPYLNTWSNFPQTGFGS